jgi:hypothetical protein
MNGLRRALLILYSLLLIAAAGGLIALAWTQDKKLDIKVQSFNLQALVSSSDNAKYLATAAFGAIALVGLITLIVAVLRDGGGGTSKGTLRMRQADGGTVEVTAVAIENLLRDELGRLPEIRRVTAKVRLNAGAVDTFLDATIEPSASISHVTAVLGEGVASVLRDQVGVTNIRRPSVRINYGEMNAGPVTSAPRGSGAAPLPPEPPLPPPPEHAVTSTLQAGEDDGAAHE